MGTLPAQLAQIQLTYLLRAVMNLGSMLLMRAFSARPLLAYVWYVRSAWLNWSLSMLPMVDYLLLCSRWPSLLLDLAIRINILSILLPKISSFDILLIPRHWIIFVITINRSSSSFMGTLANYLNVVHIVIVDMDRRRRVCLCFLCGCLLVCRMPLRRSLVIASRQVSWSSMLRRGAILHQHVPCSPRRRGILRRLLLKLWLNSLRGSCAQSWWLALISWFLAEASSASALDL